MMKISVVMPIYNTGERLYKTLVSLMGQTERDFELLMIDDASTDSLTSEIERTFCRFDARFRVIRCRENGGAAACRNLGLQTACGKYIIFLDSDDLFMPDMLEVFSRTLEENDAQISIGTFIMRDVNTDETSLFAPRALPGVTDRVFSMEELPIDGLGRWRSAQGNKMMELSYIREKKVEYQVLRDYEDVYFGFASVLLADRIVYCPLDRPLMIYQVNDPRQTSYRLDPRNGIRAYEKLLEHSEFRENDRILHQIMWALMDGLASMLRRSFDEECRRECIERAKELLRIYTSDTFFEDEGNRRKREEILEMKEDVFDKQ